MTKKQAIKLFEEKKVRTVWDDEQEKWYFSIVDVCDVLTESANPQTYWRVLKNRLKKEGNETVTNCNALKLRAAGRNDVLQTSGSVTAEEAKEYAETEFEKYRIVQDRLFQSDFDKYLEELPFIEEQQ